MQDLKDTFRSIGEYFGNASQTLRSLIYQRFWHISFYSVCKKHRYLFSFWKMDSIQTRSARMPNYVQKVNTYLQMFIFQKSTHVLINVSLIKDHSTFIGLINKCTRFTKFITFTYICILLNFNYFSVKIKKRSVEEEKFEDEKETEEKHSVSKV